MTWRIGQRIEVDGKPAIVTATTSRADHGLIIRREDDKPGVAVDWESVERLPDGSPRRLGRMIR
jgi:hypothetical protein